MTVATHPASHRRSPPPPAARRNTERDVRATSPDPPSTDAPTPRSRASSPSKTPAVAASAENTERRRLPTPRSPAVRDPQIPIGRARQTAPFLPAVSSLGGFRAPAPAHAPPSAKGRRPKPFTGRDGHWLHRALTSAGYDVYEIDPASVAVDRRARRAKSDGVDVDKWRAHWRVS